MYVHDARSSKPKGVKKLNIIVLLYYIDIISPRLLLILMYFDLQCSGMSTAHDVEYRLDNQVIR